MHNFLGLTVKAEACQRGLWEIHSSDSLWTHTHWTKLLYSANILIKHGFEQIKDNSYYETFFPAHLSHPFLRQLLICILYAGHVWEFHISGIILYDILCLDSFT